MALPPLPELALFMALVLVLSLYGLTVSGHFPEEHRSPSLRAGDQRAPFPEYPDGGETPKHREDDAAEIGGAYRQRGHHQRG